MKAKKLDEILDLCDDFCPGEPPEYFFDRYQVQFMSITAEMRADIYPKIKWNDNI